MPEAADTIWTISRVYPPDEGGVQTYARSIAETYAATGLRTTMFTKSSAGPRRLAEGRLTIIDVGSHARLGVCARLAEAMARRRLAGERPALIHACTWRAAIPALPFAPRLVVTVHGREIGRPRGAAFRLMAWVLRRAERIIAVSETTRALLLSRLPDLAPRCIVAWNGVALPAPGPAPMFERGETPAEILTLCRLVPRKNIVTAVRAAAMLAADGHHFAYWIAGRGVEDQAIRRAIAEGGVRGRVAMLGYVEPRRLDALYRSADIFLHPQLSLEGGSEVEGFGISVADAMAHGLVCIVGAEGGPAELIRHGVTGFVVDGRSPEAIHAILRELVADPTLRARIGGEARRWVEANLSWRRHCAAALAGLEPAPSEPADSARHARSTGFAAVESGG